jgi:hypothetical protein
MQHESHDPDRHDLAEIWRSAQHRRTEEVWFWLTHLFKKQPKLKSPPPHLRVLLREPPPASEESAIGSLRATD